MNLSNKEVNFKNYLFLGITIEILIIFFCIYNYTSFEEIIRHSARYSGRASFITYIGCFYYFISNYYLPSPISKSNLQKFLLVFCIMHLIHFCFLAFNVFLNDIELIPYKLGGGFLAYLMIVFYPFFMHKSFIPNYSSIIYFYYVGLVMALTFLARIKGEFTGAPVSIFHYFGILMVLIFYFAFVIETFKKKKKKLNKTS
ncbi:MAG: hypothetical protein HC854_17740 [Flavobacterium sp.]|nr:hypothetical protein [Flavobacterium sp.]